MKRILCAALLASAFVAPAAFAQDAGPGQAQRAGGQAAEKAAKQKGKEGQDCDTGRAGVRCSRPKPKKVWFWGKA
jgi:Ni/Co efflux regulator RcnB